MTFRTPKIDDFIAWKINGGHIAALTAAAYKTELERFQEFLNEKEEQKAIWAADKHDVSQFLALKRQTNAPTTTHRIFAPIKEFFKYLQHEQLRSDNPTTGIRLARIARRNDSRVTLARADVQKLLNAPTGRLAVRDRAIIHCFCSGLKRNEVQALLIGDVDLEARRLKVGNRFVPLSEPACVALAAHLQARQAKRSAILFTAAARHAATMGLRQLWHVVKSNAMRVGLDEETSPETLRTTFVVHAMEDGITFLGLIDAIGTYNDFWLRDLLEAAKPEFAKRSADLSVGALAHRAYGPGREYDFYIDLASEIAKAQANVFVIDAYIDEDLFNLYVSKIPATAKTRVLSMKFDDNVEKVASMFSSQQPIQLRKTKHIHDRHIFIDDRGWAVGQSIKEAGKKKPTYLIELSEPTLSAARAAYESLWSAATVLI